MPAAALSGHVAGRAAFTRFAAIVVDGDPGAAVAGVPDVAPVPVPVPGAGVTGVPPVLFELEFELELPDERLLFDELLDDPSFVLLLLLPLLPLLLLFPLLPLPPLDEPPPVWANWVGAALSLVAWPATPAPTTTATSSTRADPIIK
ncbi:MAG TPA: hypothetical protein VFB78_07085 [Acidimicrobiales bacterium]|nr:hypothetical protein [Acidimicrobiales bacterium]